MSKSHNLSSKLFGAPLEVFSPGSLSKRDIFRAYLWHVNGRPSVSKDQRTEYIKEVAKKMLSHWDIPEDPKIVYDKHLKCAKTNVTRVVNHGTYLQHCGSREDDQKLLDEEEKWFSQIVSLKRDDTKEATVEVSFELHWCQ